MTAVTELNVNWVALTFAAFQETAQSTTIAFSEAPTVTDDEIRAAAAMAREHGLKVCLKPVVNVTDGTWRAHIGFFDVDVPGEPTWSEWFASYGEFMLHHARLAEELKAEMFCIGCEMVRADSQEEHWRALIDNVREVYSGLITYNCDKYQEDRLTWWDAVDVITSSGYYPTGTWEEHLDRIETVVKHHQKPFMFMEIGCPSREGSPARPNDWTLVGAPSEQAQASWLDEMFTACATRDWVGGFMLWDWQANLYPIEDAPLDDDYALYGKQGAKVVATHYASLQGL